MTIFLTEIVMQVHIIIITRLNYLAFESFRTKHDHVNESLGLSLGLGKVCVISFTVNPLWLPHRGTRGWHNIQTGRATGTKVTLCLLHKGDPSRMTQGSGPGEQGLDFNPHYFSWLGALALEKLEIADIAGGWCILPRSLANRVEVSRNHIQVPFSCQVVCLDMQLHIPKNRACLASHEVSVFLLSSAPTFC